MNSKAMTTQKLLEEEASKQVLPTEELVLMSQQALLEGINLAFLVATGFTIVTLILSFFLKRVRSPQIK